MKVQKILSCAVTSAISKEKRLDCGYHGDSAGQDLSYTLLHHSCCNSCGRQASLRAQSEGSGRACTKIGAIRSGRACTKIASQRRRQPQHRLSPLTTGGMKADTGAT